VGDLLGCEVEDSAGRKLGPVHDVKVVQDGPIRGTSAALRVDALVVGGSGFAVRLGAVRKGIRGPWLVLRPLRWLERKSKVVAWGDIASITDDRIVLSTEVVD
jgi:hypothetical protein